MNWVSDIAHVSSIAAGSVTVGVKIYDKLIVTPTSETTLEKCKIELDKVKSRLNELTPRQREEIGSWAMTSKSKSLEDIERELSRLLNDRYELSERSARAAFWERCWPIASQLLKDINTLKKAVEALKNDTWNTTTRRTATQKSSEKEAQAQAQAQCEQAEHQLPLPVSSSPPPERMP